MKWEDFARIHLAEEMDQWQDLLKVEMDLQIQSSTEELLSDCAPVGFSRGISSAELASHMLNTHC